MEFKGTKGDWRFYNLKIDIDIELEDDRNINIVCVDDDKDFKGHPWCIAKVFKDVSNKDDGIANAKLIAAAPELLAILIRIKEEHGLGEKDLEQEMNAAIEKALK